jgi:hypothetical protein
LIFSNVYGITSVDPTAFFDVENLSKMTFSGVGDGLPTCFTVFSNEASDFFPNRKGKTAGTLIIDDYAKNKDA